jgi:hypothetical protein
MARGKRGLRGCGSCRKKGPNVHVCRQNSQWRSSIPASVNWEVRSTTPPHLTSTASRTLLLISTAEHRRTELTRDQNSSKKYRIRNHTKPRPLYSVHVPQNSLMQTTSTRYATQIFVSNAKTHSQSTRPPPDTTITSNTTNSMPRF